MFRGFEAITTITMAVGGAVHRARKILGRYFFYESSNIGNFKLHFFPALYHDYKEQ